jgi:uncharacterized protein involved in exopolysaccharide biosynthesis
MNRPVDTVTPDPGGATDQNEPGAPLVSRSTEAPRARRWTARDLAVRLFYRGRLFTFCLLLGLLAGLAVALVSRPTYTADTLLIVLLGSESAAVNDSLNLLNTQISIDGLKAVQSEIQIIQADGVIRAAIQDLGVARLYPRLEGSRLLGLLPPLGPDDRTGMALDRFRGDLRVEAQGSSNVIRVGFSHPDRELAIAAVQAVTHHYLAQRRSIYANDTASVLGREVRRYAARLADIEADILAVRRKFDVLDLTQDILLATNRLDGIVQRQNQVRERRVAVETEIVAVRANLASQPPEVLDFKETSNNTGNDEARNTLVRLTQERTHFATQYNGSWPGLRELDEKIAAVRAQIGASSQSLYFSERRIRNPAIGVLNNRLASLEVETQALGQQLAELDEQLRVADQRVRSLREADGQLHTLQLNRDVAEGIYRQLSLRQPGAVFNDDAIVERNANVRIGQPPTAPALGRSLALTFLAGGAFLGLLLGITAVVVATMLQQVYILPGDAERDLGLPGLGDVEADRPPDEPPDGPPDPRRGYGVVASKLLGISIDGRTLSMVQIVATSEAGRKVEVTYALGAEFARGLSMRTLILDLRDAAPATAPPAAPAAATPAGGPVPQPPPAIPVAATGEEDLWITVDARRALFGERDRMPAHAWETIGALRAHFEMVLVIASSDLSEPMAQRLARIVDANVLVLHAERTRAAIAERFREMILDAGGNLAGFVFVGRKFYVPRWLYRLL